MEEGVITLNGKGLPSHGYSMLFLSLLFKVCLVSNVQREALNASKKVKDEPVHSSQVPKTREKNMAHRKCPRAEPLPASKSLLKRFKEPGAGRSTPSAGTA